MSNVKNPISILDDLNKQNREYHFINSFYEMQNDAVSINKASGFVDQDALMRQLQVVLEGDENLQRYLPLVEQFHGARAGLKLALTAGEISEALEAVRKNKGADDHIPEFTAEEAEIADVIIRLMNYAHDRKLRLPEAIVAKNEYNRNRKDHKKDVRAADGGKKF